MANAGARRDGARHLAGYGVGVNVKCGGSMRMDGHLAAQASMDMQLARSSPLPFRVGDASSPKKNAQRRDDSA